MAALVISPEAEIDLLDIWLYIAEDHPDNADRFLDKLYILKPLSLVNLMKLV